MLKKMSSISVVRIQKGFLVWNICNLFVGKSMLLPALPKVFIALSNYPVCDYHWLRDINLSTFKLPLRDVLTQLQLGKVICCHTEQGLDLGSQAVGFFTLLLVDLQTMLAAGL